jgi:methylated-DNA-[protein]-cysteine S-methyltransferase
MIQGVLSMNLTLSKIDSPLGPMVLATDAQGAVRALEFDSHRARLHRLLGEHYEQFHTVDAVAPDFLASALRRYFEGDFDALDSVAVATAGDELQRWVWAALRSIPAGQTKSYGELARELGYTDPRKAMEIGAAVGSNPIAIIVPCHRVIGKNGELRGYAWGLRRKRWLLEHEHIVLKDKPSSEPPMRRLPGF